MINDFGLLNVFDLTNSADKPTQQGLAVGYAKMGFSIFPCNKDKVPIVDPSLNFRNGFKDATRNPKLIAKTWHRYPDASIGLALPPDVIVFDCDVRKDAEKRPILKDGMPDIIGLRAFQKLVLDLNIEDIDTLSVKTQSGGRHFYYRMPEGTSSFNHTHALECLDLKGYGGYVILPNSEGQYGHYEFLNLAEIKTIPEALLKWILQFRGKTTGKFEKLPIGTARVNRDEIIRILSPYWTKANGRRNELTLAIAGFIARSGGTEQDATFIISKLATLTGKGYDHIPGAKYAFNRKGRIKGFTTLRQLMEELGND